MIARTARAAAAAALVLACGCAPAPLETAPPPAAEPAPIQAGVAPPPGPYAPGFDALHYDLDLTLPAAGSEIRGVAGIRVRLQDERRDTLALDLTGLAVSSVRVGGTPSDFRYDAGKLRIPVPPGARVGDTLAVEIRYGGTPDDGLILRPNVHGDLSVFADNWPNRARFWFPSIDHPSDRATVGFTVRVPRERGWRVVANGLLEGEPPARADGLQVWRWATREPIPTYTMVIGAAPFAVDTIGTLCRSGRADGCVPTTTWVFPQSRAQAAPSFRRADRMLAFYDSLVAPFPYGKLAHVQSATRFGGMENVGAIFYAEEPLAQGRDIEPTVAHEVAHQWFGDAVTPADWHHLWLSEGFASYFGPLFFEHADGLDRFRAMLRASRRGYLESEVVGRPIVDPEARNLFDLLNANNYNKGAWVLHMLRGLLGDEAFFRGIREYYRRHEHGAVLTDDFRRAMEEVAGRDLEWFFDQWVLRPGHPRLRPVWRWDAASREVEITLEQTQPADWPTFRFPLELEIETAAGRIRRDVEVDERREVVRVPLSAPPTAVRLDPDAELLHEEVPPGG